MADEDLKAISRRYLELVMQYESGRVIRDEYWLPPKCECGGAALGFPNPGVGHSHWCPFAK